MVFLNLYLVCMYCGQPSTLTRQTFKPQQRILKPNSCRRSKDNQPKKLRHTIPKRVVTWPMNESRMLLEILLIQPNPTNQKHKPTNTPILYTKTNQQTKPFPSLPFKPLQNLLILPSTPFTSFSLIFLMTAP